MQICRFEWDRPIFYGLFRTEAYLSNTRKLGLNFFKCKHLNLAAKYIKLLYSQIEHMLLTGSEKYPDEHGYEQFIRLGGSFAEVDPDETSVRFETHEEFLDEALDRFSQFFKAPLMSNETTIREREIILSEFALNKNDDDVRHAQLLASLGQSGHPSNIFLCGNSKTLKENIDADELYRRALDFLKRNYSAHRMYLCLQSNRSLDDLQVCSMRYVFDENN